MGEFLLWFFGYFAIGGGFAAIVYHLSRDEPPEKARGMQLLIIFIWPVIAPIFIGAFTSKAIREIFKIEPRKEPKT